MLPLKIYLSIGYLAGCSPYAGILRHWVTTGSPRYSRTSNSGGSRTRSSSHILHDVTPSTPSNPSEPPHPPQRVLFVDDEPYLTAHYRRALADAGLVVTYAQSANEALKLVEQDTFEVVIVDLMLPMSVAADAPAEVPGADTGLWLLRRLREQPRLAKSRFVVLSSYVNAERVVHGADIPGPPVLVARKIDTPSWFLPELLGATRRSGAAS